MSESATDATVERVDAEQWYEVRVDGRRVGLTEYRDRGDQRVFFHTEVDEDFTGQGLASKLVEHALADVRDSGMRAVPVCPYVGRVLERRSEEFGGITDAVSAEVLEWLEAERA